MVSPRSLSVATVLVALLVATASAAAPEPPTERNSGIWSNELYLQLHPDVARAKMDPWTHYLRHGHTEGRTIGVSNGGTGLFDSDGYLYLNPDVRQAGFDAWKHYAQHGHAEKRRIAVKLPPPKEKIDPKLVGEFDGAGYLRLNPDVAKMKVEPWKHYSEHGHNQHRSIAVTGGGTGEFDKKTYLRLHPNVHIDAWLHYLHTGHKQKFKIAVIPEAKKAVDPSSDVPPGLRIPGKLSQICVSNEHNIWGLEKGVVLKKTPSNTWSVVNGVRMSQISCGCDSSVWGVRRPGQVYRYTENSGAWERVPHSGRIHKVFVGSSDHVWGLNKWGHPYKFNDKDRTWTRYRGRFTTMAVSCSGDMWGIDRHQDLWWHDTSTGKWAKMGVNTQDVSVGRSVYVVSNKGWLYNRHTQFSGETTWTKLGLLAQVSASDDGQVWGLSSNGGVYHVSIESHVPGTGTDGARTIVSPTLDKDVPPSEPDRRGLSAFAPGQKTSDPDYDDAQSIVNRPPIKKEDTTLSTQRNYRPWDQAK